MKILSTKLPLKDDVTKEQIYQTIIRWLKDNKQCKVAAEKFEQAENKDAVRIVEGYVTLETLTGKRNEIQYLAVRLTHIYKEQTWETELLYGESVTEKSVTIHIHCLGDATLFKKPPIVRTEIIRAFIADGLAKNGKLPIQATPIYADYDTLDYLATVMTTRYDQPIPMVYVSKIFDSSGYNSDIDKLSRNLAGIAHIVVEQNGDFAYNLKERTNGNNPFNGHIAIYYPNGKIDRLRQSDIAVYGAADSRILADVIAAVTAQVDKDAPTWQQLYTDKIAADTVLLEDYMSGYDSLEDKLKAAKEKITALTEENTVLRNKNDSLQAALSVSGIEENIISKSPVEEFYEGEQHDLLVTVLREAATRCGGFEMRQYELINSLLENNDYIGNGRETLEVVKKVLSSGEAIGKREIAELERVGFKLVAEQNHYKIVYRGNERYWFTISKTPSDRRSGQNNASDIIKRLTVYQSDKK
ncbi:MAG: hypothetical protein K2L51_01265 [Clostridiales bacterium]|nr:hypothetical protein [Clostridiales bacterium]